MQEKHCEDIMNASSHQETQKTRTNSSALKVSFKDMHFLLFLHVQKNWNT